MPILLERKSLVSSLLFVSRLQLLCSTQILRGVRLGQLIASHPLCLLILDHRVRLVGLRLIFCSNVIAKTMHRSTSRLISAV
jgi:hypothetical protein